MTVSSDINSCVDTDCRSVIASLHRHASAQSDAPAVIELTPCGQRRRLTWAQMYSAAIAYADRFARNSQLGDCIVITAPNRLETFPAFFGALMAGCKVFPLAPTVSSDEFANAVALVRPAAAVVTVDQKQLAYASARLVLTFADFELDVTFGSDTPAQLGEDAGLLLQSSGTTGMPKVVERSMAAVNAVASGCRDAICLSSTDRVLGVIPVHHAYGVEHVLLAPAMAGACVLLVTNFDLLAVERAIVDDHATVFPGVPFMLESLQDSTCWSAAADTLRCVYTAGSPLPASVASKYEEEHAIRIGQVFGATELGSLTFSDPLSNDFDPRSVGRPLEAVEIRIVRRSKVGLEDLPNGSEGQIAVRAGSMLDRYLGDDELPFVEGFFLTGDLGVIDCNGRLYLTGRTKLLIDVGGQKVNPMEVEAALCKHPQVREALVVPMQINQTMARPRALIVPSDNTEPDVQDIRNFLRSRLSRHKIPRTIEVRTELPRTSTGKVLRELNEHRQ